MLHPGSRGASAVRLQKAKCPFCSVTGSAEQPAERPERLCRGAAFLFCLPREAQSCVEFPAFDVIAEHFFDIYEH